MRESVITNNSSLVSRGSSLQPNNRLTGKWSDDTRQPNTGSSRTAALPLETVAVCHKWCIIEKESHPFLRCRDDEVIPLVHLALYAQERPQTTIREIESEGHQLRNDLTLAAEDIKSL